MLRNFIELVSSGIEYIVGKLFENAMIRSNEDLNLEYYDDPYPLTKLGNKESLDDHVS